MERIRRKTRGYIFFILKIILKLCLRAAGESEKGRLPGSQGYIISMGIKKIEIDKLMQEVEQLFSFVYYSVRDYKYPNLKI